MLLNLAAGHIALKEFGAATRRCNEAVDLDPQNIKALLRRAKAHTGRREYEARAGGGVALSRSSGSVVVWECRQQRLGETLLMPNGVFGLLSAGGRGRPREGEGSGALELRRRG